MVRTAAGAVLLDTTGKVAGRGAYLCPTAECLALAVKRKAIERALQCALDSAVVESLALQMAAAPQSTEPAAF